MTSGEKRIAVRLVQKLDTDYLIWYDVPIGKKQRLMQLMRSLSIWMKDKAIALSAIRSSEKSS
ncbi:MAG: hypothetical protein DCF19_04700 [Pseudanabaena frigida]|uniref:Uncharacterized protein n=1 Tax=Pseudanabaena frigida TaxID=945775 RepID=A0A2W4WED8_9CYAN|nr:MAG: hypothetical protein DCF19_04700 [Pseudanabaena frigida]